MRKAFTLVETLVAIGLFTVLVAIASGGFTNALRTQRQVAALIGAQSNASLALEQMAREIRTGYLFCHGVPIPPDTRGILTCTGCSISGTTWTCPELNFQSAATANVDYSLAGGALMRNENSGGAQPITGDNVRVAYLTFVIFGNLENDHWNPRITISMGVAPNSNDPAVANDVVNVQTTVSARQIDCNASGC